MILGRILDFLAAHRVASLGEIAAAVGSSPDAVQGMLDTLQRKGLVHRYQPQGGCGTTCRQCTQGTLEVYGHGPAPSLPGGVVKCEGLEPPG
jgi:hypothetical protein